MAILTRSALFSDAEQFIMKSSPRTARGIFSPRRKSLPRRQDRIASGRSIAP